MNSAELIVGYLGVIVIVSLLICLAIVLHTAYTQIDLILGCLKNCTAIKVRSPLKHGGPWGRLLLIGGISGVLTFPGPYLKRGELCPEDLKNFPIMLKRKLVVMQWCIIILMISIVLLALVGKSGLLK